MTKSFLFPTRAFIAGTTALMALFTLHTPAVAQYNGPGKRAPEQLPVLRTVTEVLAKPVDDQRVHLSGTLVRQTGNETFQFRDATGEIQVEIDDDDFPRGQPIGADTPVTIVGEVETRAMRAPEIDAEQLILAPAASPATP
jgi:uncharacterized protein (TIGR00156 family)